MCKNIQNCEDCTNYKTVLCAMCTIDDSYFMTQKEKDWNDWMCECMCGGDSIE